MIKKETINKADVIWREVANEDRRLAGRGCRGTLGHARGSFVVGLVHGVGGHASLAALPAYLELLLFGIYSFSCRQGKGGGPGRGRVGRQQKAQAGWHGRQAQQARPG